MKVLVGQSGGATAVINASLCGVVETAQQSQQFDQILGMKGGIEGLLRGEVRDLTDLPAKTLDGLRRTPSSALGTGRYKLKHADLPHLLQQIHDLGVTDIVFIGGNDSADTTHRLAEAANGSVRVVHVPKTVDNDLEGTDHCPGYGSMARVMANVVRDATYDTLAAPALYPVKFIETVGRDAGWVAAAGVLGFSVPEWDLLPIIHVPERKPASAGQIVQAVADDLANRGWSVVVVPETLTDISDRHLGGDTPSWVDEFGHAYFPSAGDSLARATSEALGVRARYERVGSWARMCMSLISDADMDEAWRVGAAAVESLLRGETGVMMALQRQPGAAYACDVVPVPVQQVANSVRQIPEAFLSGDMHAVNSNFINYAHPLLGSNPVPPYTRL